MSEQSPICFYHSRDFDGRASGVICARAVPDVEMYGYDYGQAFPWDKVRGRDVFMIDVSLEPWDQMVRLASEAKSLTFIDHHKSSIEKEMDDDSGFSSNVLGVRRVGWDEVLPSTEIAPSERVSACELAWLYFFPDEPMPLAIHLIGRFDIWDHADPRVRPFQYGCRSMVKNGVADALWDDLVPGVAIDDEESCPVIEEIIKTGQIILEYDAQRNDEFIREYAFKANIGKYTVLAVNSGHKGSLQFESIWNSDEYDMMMIFCLRPDGRWQFSLYSDKEDIDVSMIAKTFGGGGHRGAAGFTSTELPFKDDLFMKHALRLMIAVDALKLEDVPEPFRGYWTHEPNY